MTTTRNAPTPLTEADYLPMKALDARICERYPGRRARIQADIDRLRSNFQDPEKAYMDENGIRRWASNDAVIPPCVLRDGCVRTTEAHQEHYDIDTRRAMANYRRARANRSPEQRAEENAMARAAHGPGVELVNIITGERFTT